MALNKITEIIRGFPDWSGESVSDFEEWVSTVSSRNKTVVYRGQRKYWPLLPRRLSENSRWSEKKPCIDEQNHLSNYR